MTFDLRHNRNLLSETETALLLVKLHSIFKTGSVNGSELLYNIASACEFLGYSEYHYARDGYSIAEGLKLLNADFPEGACMLGFIIDDKVKPHEFPVNNKPTVAYSFNHSQFCPGFDKVIRNYKANFYIAFDKQLSQFLFLHSDGIIGHCRTSDLIRLAKLPKAKD